jgi:hypothetical protein
LTFSPCRRPQSSRGAHARGRTLDLMDAIAIALALVTFAVLALLIEGIDRV